FDMRCKDVATLVMDVSVEPVTSLCFKTGTEIKCFDVRLATKEWKLLENYNYNKEEINKVVCNLKSSFLAAADDSGEVKADGTRRQSSYLWDWKDNSFPLLDSAPSRLNPTFFGIEQYFAAKSLISSRGFEIDDFHGFGMVPLADL
ncbi:hypothetical protein S83_058764, partial [Arachis hypogaea]